MVPAQMPLPMPTYLPFHPLAGSHTSDLMSESLEGLSVAWTRQKAGKFAYRPAPMPGGPPPPAGGWNAPAATTLAAVTLPVGRASWARSPHSAATAGDAANAVAAAPHNARRFVIMTFSRTFVCPVITRF